MAKPNSSDEEEEKGREGHKRRRRDDSAGTGNQDDKKDERDEDSDSRRRDRRRRGRKHKSQRRREKASSSSSSDEETSNSSEEERRRRKRRKRHKKTKRAKKKRSKRDGTDADSRIHSSDEESSDNEPASKSPEVRVNQKLLAKLAARGETLEERRERKAQARAAKIQVEFGYTAQENPFNDPNLHEPFTWGKKKQQQQQQSKKPAASKHHQDTMEEIKKVRQRRLQKQQEQQEIARLQAEESRMKEQETYDEWMQKEEEFHLLQQKQRSAIRLVEGREKPIDVLAKNLLLFGMSDDDTKDRVASTVKYQERYNALNELETMEAELQEPHEFLKLLKLHELQELLHDIDAFRRLERESSASSLYAGSNRRDTADNVILRYWDDLHLVTQDEVLYLQSGGDGGTHAKVVQDILKLFDGQSQSALEKMREEIIAKQQQQLRDRAAGGSSSNVMEDVQYWQTVLRQLQVYLAKQELSDLHEKMLVRQLERLESKKEELQAAKAKGIVGDSEDQDAKEGRPAGLTSTAAGRSPTDAMEAKVNDMGDLEQELGLEDEYDLYQGKSGAATSYSWQEKWRPRKPRYFNRVKTGYDWNKYNQTHYDHDNPPPKTVQGYKFNIFYPELIDKTKTPQFFIEPADSPEFCILRFHAGPPYEDIAFKIINREWNRSRKRGFRSTFERGVLSLYFNFTTHWYRR